MKNEATPFCVCVVLSIEIGIRDREVKRGSAEPSDAQDNVPVAGGPRTPKTMKRTSRCATAMNFDCLHAVFRRLIGEESVRLQKRTRHFGFLSARPCIASRHRDFHPLFSHWKLLREAMIHTRFIDFRDALQLIVDRSQYHKSSAALTP